MDTEWTLEEMVEALAHVDVQSGVTVLEHDLLNHTRTLAAFTL